MIALRKNPRRLLVATVVAAGLFVSATFAATQDDATNGAARALEIARLRLKLYERVDYPLRVRQLQTEITLMEARVASLRRRVKETERFRYAEGLFTTTEHLRLALLEAEVLLEDLKHERTLLQLHNQDERRLRQLEIEDLQGQAR